MREFLDGPGCLMEFLRRELDDPQAAPCGRCARCLGHSLFPHDVDADARARSRRLPAQPVVHARAAQAVARRHRASRSTSEPSRAGSSASRATAVGADGRRASRPRGAYGDELVDALVELSRGQGARPDARRGSRASRRSAIPSWCRRSRPASPSALQLPFRPGRREDPRDRAASRRWTTPRSSTRNVARRVRGLRRRCPTARCTSSTTPSTRAGRSPSSAALAPRSGRRAGVPARARADAKRVAGLDQRRRGRYGRIETTPWRTGGRRMTTAFRYRERSTSAAGSSACTSTAIPAGAPVMVFHGTPACGAGFAWADAPGARARAPPDRARPARRRAVEPARGVDRRRLSRAGRRARRRARHRPVRGVGLLGRRAVRGRVRGARCPTASPTAAVAAGMGQVGVWATTDEFEKTDRQMLGARDEASRGRRGCMLGATGAARARAARRPAMKSFEKQLNDSDRAVVADARARRPRRWRCSPRRSCAARTASSPTTRRSRSRGDSRSKTIRVPTTVFHGDADTMVPLRHGEELAARVPNARLTVWPGAGHLGTVAHVGEVLDALR